MVCKFRNDTVLLLTEIRTAHRKRALADRERQRSDRPSKSTNAGHRPSRSAVGTFLQRGKAQINVPLQVEWRFGHEVSPHSRSERISASGDSPSASTTEVSDGVSIRILLLLRSYRAHATPRINPDFFCVAAYDGTIRRYKR